MKVLWKLIKDWIPTIVIVLILNFLITHYVFVMNIVPTASMDPTIKVNDRVFTLKLFNKSKLKYGDIVTFHPPLKTTDIFVKRLIGVGGDVIEVKNGSLYINNNKKQENFLHISMNYNYGPITIPSGKYFFLGDNRNNSYDSHLWETTPFVDKSAIIGKSKFIVFPFSEFGSI
jgi:signal peptidase I